MSYFGAYFGNPPVSGGGGDGSGLTAEQIAQLLSDTAYTANRLRAVGTPDQPLVILAAQPAPENTVLVYWNPTEFLQPATIKAEIGYVQNTDALNLTTSIEVPQNRIKFTEPRDETGELIPGALAYAYLPLKDAVKDRQIYLYCPKANHDETNPASQCYVKEPPERGGGLRYWLMSELLDRAINPLT